MQWLMVPTLCLIPLAAVADDDDRGFLTRLIEDNLSDAGRTVRIEGFAGALSSRARIASLTIADDDGIWLRLTDVALDWQRSALLSGRLEVASLTAAEITLDRLPGTSADPAVPRPEATPFALPDLPISVTIGQLRADRITLGPTVLGQPLAARLDGAATLADGAGTAQVRLERVDDRTGLLDLRGAYANADRHLTLDLTLAEPAGGIAATLLGLPGAPALDLTVTGDDPLDDFTARLRLASGEEERLTGTLTLATDDSGANRFDADLGGDVTPLFLPAYHAFFGPDVALQAAGQRATDGRLVLDQLDLRTAALSLTGAAAIAADGLPKRLALDLDLGRVDGAPVRLPLTGDPVDLRAARLHLGFDAARDDGWTLAGQIVGLDAPAIRARRLDLDGAGRIRRDADRPAVSGRLQFSGQKLVATAPELAALLGEQLAGALTFTWAEGQPLTLSEMVVTGTDYQMSGRSTVAGPATAPVVDGALRVGLTDLGRLSGLAGRRLGGSGMVEWQGWLAPLSGAFDGVLTVAGMDIALDQPEADALLQGDSRIRLNAARGAEGIEIRELTARAATLRLAAQGWLRSTGPALTAEFALDDLGALGPGYGGRLQAKAELTGTALDNGLHLTLTGTGHDLRPGQPVADGLLQGETALDLVARLDDGILGVERLHLANGTSWSAEASGTLAATARTLAARFRLADLHRAGAGFGGTLAGDLSYELADGLETARLSANADNLAIGQPMANRLLRGTTRLTVAGRRDAGMIRLDTLELTNPQLSANGTAQEDDTGRRLDLTARLNDLGLIVAEIPGPVTLAGRIDEAAGTMHTGLTLQGPGGIAAQLAGTAASDLGHVALTLNGTADAALAAGFLGPATVRGPLAFRLGINGVPGLDAVHGEVTLSNGHATLSNPPFAVSDLGVQVRLAGRQATLAAQARADTGGTISLVGPVALQPPFAGALRINLDNLIVQDPRLYRSRVSGAVTVDGPLANGARIGGDITLAETELQIPSTGLGGTAAIPDLRHRGEPAPVRLTRARAGLLETTDARRGGPAYPLNLTIRAPNRIFIRGRGLGAELGGAFRIGGTTAAVVPDGGLELIRGRLDLLGKRFTLDEGWLQLQGSMIPTLHLVASSTTIDGTASIIVDGPADAPEIHFVSTPELPEEEVIARLLFGRDLTALTPLQAARLAAAVATLTGRGGGGVVDRLRQSFGLDDLDLGATEDGTAAVRAGRYLSENIYLDLELDSEGRSTVSINLDLSPSLTLRGRTDDHGSSALGLHYERDY